MSARLKLKKLKREMESVLRDCKRREAEAMYEKRKCYKLLQENILEVGAIAELYPCNTMRGMVDCLDANIRSVTSAIVHEYTKPLAEYVRNQLIMKYQLKSFSTFRVRLLAPTLTEEHVKVEIEEFNLW